MKKQRIARSAAAGILIILIACALPAVMNREASIPGLSEPERTLLRIWVVNAPGGGQAWLKGQLKAFEKQHPGISTYLRNVAVTELNAPGVVPPDVLLYMPGDLSTPQEAVVPLTGAVTQRDTGFLREPLLRCGRLQGQQYGLPLCWGAWALCIDSALEPGSAQTPAPTTLLGRPASTVSQAVTEAPGYPLDAASSAACPLQAPGGTALFTLGLLLEKQPPLPETFATLTSSDVYRSFQARQCATAMLTSGQVTAFEGIVSGGSGFPFRVMTAQEVITDQVWLASITPGAPAEAASLLAHLTNSEAQRALSAQGLHTVRDDLMLYAAGVPAALEAAAARSLTAINAYVSPEMLHQAAWQYFKGKLSLSDALLPLL